ncbi:hypothetical protein PIB30_005382 [Stylosanthes scabra]|uniref:Disease resistance R13L4/SHOC-2-like LRR domain-containing protein n=1 Tax=Stylosanthes scabra TaxID=79078 RepID=A0ABU6W3K0_9FABA|nr:hypothetical protein [Stylosanthes scabra]
MGDRDRRIIVKDIWYTINSFQTTIKPTMQRGRSKSRPSLAAADFKFRYLNAVKSNPLQYLTQCRNGITSNIIIQVAEQVFDSLLSDQVVLPSSLDPYVGSYGTELFKINQSKLKFSPIEYATVFDGNVDSLPNDLNHLSIDHKSIKHVGFESTLRFKDLQTLFVTPTPGFYVDQVPRDVFLRLKHLRALSFRRSHIKELPNSKAIRGCFKLYELPKEFGNLTSLTHLDFDIIGHLDSMPHGMGNLTNLQTLSGFIVGKDYGRRIVELKDLVDLTGAFCISKIENVSSSEEAQEVDLSVDMRLYNCINCECLLPIGKLPALRFLWVDEMDKLERIDEHFCRGGEDQEYHAFPKLEELSIRCMPQLKEWAGAQNGDFPCLHKLQIKYCPELHSLPVLSCLDSLKRLELSYCPNISSFPDGKVFRSLEYLSIRHCSELTKNFKNEEGKYWGERAHVSRVFIDDEDIAHLKWLELRTFSYNFFPP